VTWNVFHAWKQFQQDCDRAALQQRVEPIKTQMRPLLEWGSTGKRQRHVSRAREEPLEVVAPRSGRSPTSTMWSRPTTRPSVGLRAAVIYRKLSLGSRSQGGERTIERLLSVDQTCRLAPLALRLPRRRPDAKARGDPVPSPMGA
jgi:hypothetical protein